MNPYEVGGLIFLAFVVVAWTVYTERRVRNIENTLLRTREALIDDQISSKNHALSDAEINDLLRTDLRGD